MATQRGWTDQDVLIIALAGQSLAYAAADDPGFREARGLNDEWFMAIQQYAAVVENGPTEQLPACRAALIRMSRRVFDAVNWGTVKNAADTAWLKEQLDGLEEQDDDDDEEEV